MFRYFLIFSLSTFVSVHLAISQKNQRTAVIISYENDTIQGLINVQNFEKDPKSITFKHLINGNTSIQSPMEVKEIIIDDDYYFGAIIQVESSPKDLGKLSNSPSFQYRKDTVFIQRLVDGDKSLYAYRDINSKNHFLILQNDSLVSLITKKYRTGEVGSDYAESKLFIGQLKVYFEEFPDLFGKIEKTEYTTKSLLNLFLSYYQLIGSQPNYIKNNESLKIDIGVIAGVSFTKLNTDGTIFPYVAEAEYPVSTDFAGGISFDLIMPRNNGRLSFNTELLYTKYNTAYTYRTYENDNYYSIIDTELGFSYLKLNVMPRYRFFVNNNAFFVNTGISIGFVVSTVNTRSEYNKFYSEEIWVKGQALDYTQNVHLGYYGGMGFKWKKILTEIRYEYGGKITNYFKLSTNTDKLYFLVGYIL